MVSTIERLSAIEKLSDLAFRQAKLEFVRRQTEDGSMDEVDHILTGFMSNFLKQRQLARVTAEALQDGRLPLAPSTGVGPS